MTTTIAMTSIDCAEVGPVARFWSELLDLPVEATDDFASYAMLRGETGPALGFGRVEGWVAPGWPNEHGSKQFHLDVAVDDLDAAQTRAVGLGATLVDPQPGETWRVLLDPAGHPFCLTDAGAWG